MLGSMRVSELLGALAGVAVIGVSCSHSPRLPGKAGWDEPCERDEDCAVAACHCGRCADSCDDGTGGRGSGAGDEDASEPASSGGRAPRLDAGVSPGGKAGSGGSQGADSGAGGYPAPGGRPSTGGVPSDRPDPSDFRDAQAPQDFTDPVALPPPVPGLKGDLDAFVGTWAHQVVDGEPCNFERPGSDATGAECVRLTIRKEAGGTYSGTVLVQASAMNPRPVSGPFAPATDRSAGYPVGVDPKDYYHLRSLAPSVEYRVFDGVFRDGTLTFWISPLDIYQGWCALQTPHEWSLEEGAGRKEYRCVPPSANETNTDYGKLALCTSAEDFPLCPLKDATYYRLPCVCVNDQGQADGSSPLCSLSVCECSPGGCVAFTRNTSMSFNLRYDGKALIGSFSAPSLLKEAP
jgi:hypothetical protein